MFESVIKSFNFHGDLTSYGPYGEGHINSTFLLEFKSKSGNIRKYILQKINTSVFSNPDALMRNICMVTEFLREKIRIAGGNTKRETLNFIPCNTGKYYFVDDNGNCWRAYRFVDNTSTYQVVENPVHFYMSPFLPDLSDIKSPLFVALPHP